MSGFQLKLAIFAGVLLSGVGGFVIGSGRQRVVPCAAVIGNGGPAFKLTEKEQAWLEEQRKQEEIAKQKWLKNKGKYLVP